jgi:hypothetical protein
MGDDGIVTSVAKGAFEALEETERTVVCMIFIFAFCDENFDEDWIAQIAVVDEIDDGVMVANADKSRP